jgi:hypothetical protein
VGGERGGNFGAKFTVRHFSVTPFIPREQRRVIDVRGELELDDGRGGGGHIVLLRTVPLFGQAQGLTASFTSPPTERSGLCECSFAGDWLLLHSLQHSGRAALPIRCALHVVSPC